MRNRGALAKEWFERGRSDLRGVRHLLEAEDYTTTLAVLIHQAVEKHLKGFLVYHGWKLKRTRNLVELVSEAAQFDPALRTVSPFRQERYSLLPRRSLPWTASPWIPGRGDEGSAAQCRTGHPKN